MTQPSHCPDDRSELLSVLENRAAEQLRTHVDGCERCRLEVQELESALELISAVAEAPPSERVRREAVAYARAQVRSQVRAKTLAPAAQWTWWRAPAAGMAGVVLAVLFGGLAEARVTLSAPEIASPEPWTLVLAAAWGLGLCLYAMRGAFALRREMLANALAGAAAFALLLLAFPISEAVKLCVTWAFGPGQLSSGEAAWAFACMASLYAALPAALAGRISDADLSWLDACRAAFVFALLAAPLLLVQAAPLSTMAVIGCLACGAWTGERLVSIWERVHNQAS